MLPANSAVKTGSGIIRFLGMHRFDVSSSLTSACRFESKRKRVQKNTNVKSTFDAVVAKVAGVVNTIADALTTPNYARLTA